MQSSLKLACKNAGFYPAPPAPYVGESVNILLDRFASIAGVKALYSHAADTEMSDTRTEGHGIVLELGNVCSEELSRIDALTLDDLKFNQLYTGGTTGGYTVAA